VGPTSEPMDDVVPEESRLAIEQQHNGGISAYIQLCR
jgi:hypothetical protein